MKFRFYTPTSPKLLTPCYEGYRSKFFPSHNQPKQALKDFPQNTCDFLLEPKVGDINSIFLYFSKARTTCLSICADVPCDIKVNFIEPDGFHFKPIDLVVCDEPEYFAETIAIILSNLKKNGKAIIAMNYKCQYLDLITLCSQYFGKIAITSGYIVFQNFDGPSTVPAFIKYFIDSGKLLCAYENNPDRKNLLTLLK